MSRVIIDTKNTGLEEASAACPCNCFKKNGNEFVIDGSQCIDCGVCQTVVDEGVIVEDSEANEDAINYNNNNAEQWEAAQ